MNCISKSNLNNKYIEDPLDPTNYIRCEHKYNNCDTCNNNQCLFCQNDYTFIEGNRLNCFSKNDLKNKYIQDPLDPSNVIECKNKYNNCDECNNSFCISCLNGFTFIEGNKLNCVKISDLNNTYIPDPFDKSNYIKCENKYNNCQCFSCKDDFTFINGNKSICIKKGDLKNKYAQDPSDPSNYIKCSHKYNNCDSCDNSQCISCQSDFTFIEGNRLNCVSKSDLNNTHIEDPLIPSNAIKCENRYNNCYSCNNSQCISCQNDFTFIEGNKLNCIKISDLKNKYAQDPLDPSNYIKCENKYNNCDSCNNSLCISCKDDFTFINRNKSICIKKSGLKNKYIKDPLDIYNYIKCDYKYNNCDTCTNSQCISCKNEYIFINDDYTICNSRSLIDLQFSYTNDNIMYYSCNLTKYRNKKQCKTLLKETSEKETEVEEKSLTKELYILQVQIIDKLLKVFLTLSEKIEKGFHIKLSINLFKNKNKQRNLQEPSSGEYEVDLYLENYNDEESGNIVSLTSQEEFDDNDRIVVNQQQSNEYELKVLNNDNNILDTLENKKKLDNKEVFDFSQINSNSEFSVNKYYIESASKGCSFNLVSKMAIKENNKEINIIFVEKDNVNNNINAKCTLSSNNNKNIPCSFEQEVDEKNYDLQSYVGSDENGLFFIFQDNKEFQLSCSEEDSDKNKKKIIIALAAGAIILLIIIISCCCCCKKKKVEKIENTENNIGVPNNKVISFNNNATSYRGLNNQRINLFQYKTKF